ncbi:MAG: hypothetical protein HY242_15400 [Afipia sp.]|nr:hypothetical protein [Afipia sp.]
MMNKSLRGGSPKSSGNRRYGFHEDDRNEECRRRLRKKEPPFLAAFESL